MKTTSEEGKENLVLGEIPQDQATREVAEVGVGVVVECYSPRIVEIGALQNAISGNIPTTGASITVKDLCHLPQQPQPVAGRKTRQQR